MTGKFVIISNYLGHVHVILADNNRGAMRTNYLVTDAVTGCIFSAILDRNTRYQSQHYLMCYWIRLFLLYQMLNQLRDFAYQSKLTKQCFIKHLELYTLAKASVMEDNQV